MTKVRCWFCINKRKQKAKWLQGRFHKPQLWGISAPMFMQKADTTFSRRTQCQRAVLINMQGCLNTKAMKQRGRKSSLDVKLMSTSFTSWMPPSFFLSFSFFGGGGQEKTVLLGSTDPLVSASWVAGVQACVTVLDTQICKLAFGNRAVSKQGFTFIDICSSMCCREKAAACIDRDVWGIMYITRILKAPSCL